MYYQFTPGAQRAFSAAAAWSGREHPNQLGAPALLLGLLAEPECRAAIVLARHGINISAVQSRWTELTPSETTTGGVPVPFSVEVEASLQVVSERLRDYPQPLELATEHLLLGLAAADHEVSAWLRQQGLDPGALEAEIHRIYGYRPGPLPIDPLPVDETSSDIPTEDPYVTPRVCRRNDRTEDSSSTVDPITPQQSWRPREEGIPVLRIVDAAANRAREGLRAVEDYLRFVLDDRYLTGQCKQLRHDLAAALERIPVEHRLAARETQADVGTALTTQTERHRETAAGVLTANFTRLQEGLRSLEEYGKLHDPDLAAELKQLRYRSYTLQRAVQITAGSLKRLARARLYVLIDGRPSPEEFERLARSLIDAGVPMLQLRDKQLDDRRLLERARLLRRLTDGRNTLLIVNDRPDLAVLARADGVHVGQEELSVKDARTIVGPESLIGVSTHSIEQARQAVLDGANYLGIGPVFPSGTKSFDGFPGVELLREVAAEIRLPAFAIGGITGENLSEVLATGFTRAAVSGAITAADDPAAKAKEMFGGLGFQ